jgi:hypothetical protein
MMMKKLKIAAIAAVVGVSCYFGYKSVKPAHEFSATEIENIEALADGEGVSVSWRCWSMAKSDSGGFWRCGSPCSWVDGMIGIGEAGQCYTNL